MGRSNPIGTNGVVAVLVVMVVVLLANDVNAQRYTCWGGCYNECILRNTKTQPDERFPCYLQCLNKCVPRSPDDYQYFCEVGCSMTNCNPNTTSDGAVLEKCFDRCTDQCKNSRQRRFL